MMLFKIAFKNIQKSIKDYAIYFFTLILGVAIFYVFNAIDSQTVMMNVSKSTHQIIDLMNSMLSGVSVFVSFILGFLIIYASRFLIKRRKKEFGIYMTLGMSKGKISKILLCETILIGLLSLVVGLVFGVFLSQFMSILVVKMFEADMTQFAFTFSSSAFIKTCIYFGIMYLLVMIFNTYSIGKCKLIDLLHASKKAETVRIKNPWISVLVFLIAVGILGYAYYNVTALTLKLTQEKLLFMIALGIVGTFLLFWSLSGLILRIVMSMKGLYRRGLNTFILRQFDYKLNTTVFSMTVICLMLFLTIGILSSALSIKNSMTSNLKTLAPVDAEFSKKINVSGSNLWGRPYTEGQMEDSRISIPETLEKFGFSTSKYLKDVVMFDTYQLDTLTFRKTLGLKEGEVLEAFPMLQLDSSERVIRLSDYNKVAHLYHQPTYTLESDEYLIIADYDSMIEVRNVALSKNISIQIGDRILSPKYSKCKPGFLEMNSTYMNTGIIIVPDDAIADEYRSNAWLVANYQGDSQEEKERIEDILQNLSDHPYAQSSVLSTTSKLAIYESSVGLGALITFIGIYLGIIFLISSAAMLALKELSESSDNREKYKVLRKIGVDEKMIHKALFLQIAIFFTFPLLIAIIHSIFGLQFANTLLITFGNQKLLASILMTAGFLLFIYGGYFFLTYICSKNIIKE